MTTTTKVPASSQRALAFEGVITLIVRGILKPEQRTSEAQLEEMLRDELHLRINRTAVRQALAIMFRDGLIGQRPQSGVWVWPVSPDEAAEVLQLRERIEPPAIATLLSIEINDDGSLAQAESVLNTLENANDVDDYLLADGDFHASLMRAAGSSLAAMSLSSWSQRLRVFFRTSGEEFGTLNDGDVRWLFVDLNRQIFASLRKRDADVYSQLTTYFESWAKLISHSRG